MAIKVIHGISLFSDYDIHLFKEGKHFRLWEKLGAHVYEHEEESGVLFSVWAPNAESVWVMGDFNEWNTTEYKLEARWDASGIWEGFIPGIEVGALYKYVIKSTLRGELLEKTDPFATQVEVPPKTASIIHASNYKWKDETWETQRKDFDFSKPMSTYEVHLGSWKRNADGNSLSYKELAEQLVPYVKECGFTHVEFLPVMEHPFFGSWGYQVTNFFAPSSRFGTPEDFKFLIDAFHAAGIAVILDWVPSHFPGDDYALKEFDGSHLYEHEDERRGFHPDWKSYIFNYGRFEVLSFLISNALYWLEEFHADGLRVDAVASMLYLDYSRNEGEWLPNEFGGNENLEAIHFLKTLNNAIHNEKKGYITIAEESTAWPKVTDSTDNGGLGFHYKWMMGWMHDTLRYFGREPIYRKYHQNELTFSMWYFRSEHYVLAISHDEVVYGKYGLLNKMNGDEWHKFSNLRLFYGYMFTHPGAKLLFMGQEFAQYNEWNHDKQLEWDSLQDEKYKSVQLLVTDLNSLYTNEEALHVLDFQEEGFLWTDIENHDDSLLCFMRSSEEEHIIVVCNFDQQTHLERKIKVPSDKNYRELLNTDDEKYGGSGLLNLDELIPAKIEIENEEEVVDENILFYEITIMVPPLSIILLKPVF
ncbi:MAG: 1,4-alpha-glucan branching protein GlgB [Bacteroidetes bacterium]|nr:1,4-alpha-glucan branching protein GlgB [Bacteroidota bacterium]MBK8487779.1 1,4-alpha-glucan branching protein GlgB [Bacteroidota bacterium]